MSSTDSSRTDSTATTTGEALAHPRSRSAFRTLRTLVASYAALSAATLAVAYLLRGHSELVTATVWIRGGVVALTSLLMLAFVARSSRGSRRAYLRLRIASAVMVVAVAVMASLPGVLPGWMRVEQALCGVLLLGVVGVANGRHLRSVLGPARPGTAR